MNEERNKYINNDEKNNSSLYPSLNKNALEYQGQQLEQASRLADTPPPISNINKGAGMDEGEGTSMPSQHSPNSVPKNSIPNKNNIQSGQKPGASNSGMNKTPQLPNKNGLANKNGLSNLSGGKNALQNKVASAGLQAAGVPKVASDALVNSKMGQKAMKTLQNPEKAALDGIKNIGKSEAEKDAAEKEEEEKGKDKRNGFVTLRIPLKVKLIIFLGIVPAFCFIFIFLIIIVGVAGDKQVTMMFVGEMSASEANDLRKFANEVGMAGYIDGVGTANGGPTYNELLSRFENLGNIFEYFDCEKDECLERDEVKFYIKINDIALRYSKIHNVKINWTLLLATVTTFGLDANEIFMAFYNNYDYDAVEDFDKLMILDWNYDYKKISGYQYLDSDDYRYDLQILAKNMIRKTTTQTCTKCTTATDGTVTCVVTKTQTDLDIEDEYLKPGKEYYLKCSAGETYDISNDYRYDEDKFDEFLNEYIEHKFFLPGTGNKIIEGGQVTPNPEGNTDMTPSPASGDYIFPLPSGSTNCRSSAYGYRVHPISGEYHYHSGDDYPAPAGTAVYAVADGTVSASANSGWNGGMGNYVIINHENGVQSIYMHASKVYVSAGDKVKQGDVIMAVGTTGSSTGNHLHITFKLNGELNNPGDYIGALKMCGT